MDPESKRPTLGTSATENGDGLADIAFPAIDPEDDNIRDQYQAS